MAITAPGTLPAGETTSLDTLLDRWFQVQASLMPLLKELTESFQGEDHALMLLTRTADGMAPSELARAMGITPGRASNLLRQLEDKGQVRRIRSADNRRTVTVEATQAGFARAEASYARDRARQAAVFQTLGPADSAELLRIAARIAREADHTATAGGDAGERIG